MIGEPTRDRRGERRSATRAEIREAAWEVARANGVAGLSLREVAQRVGLRPPSLYSYYDSKSALLDAMFAQGCQTLLQRQAAVPLDGDPQSTLAAVLRMFVGFCTEDPARYQLLFQRTVPGFMPTPESYAIAIRNIDTLRGQLAAAGVEDPAHMDMFTAVAAGLADQQIANDPGGDRWTRLIDDAARMLLTHTQARATHPPTHKHEPRRAD
ncbi:TetR/AcrR family transcriptional regulator [Streptomyces violascens]|uniref:TetR/AcrR family transcriptional regulator n=1 Tax=Streptomyces violascens TaxID=67381 RepID=UPI0036666C83